MCYLPMALLDTAEVNRLWKTIIATWTFFECWVFAGIFYGWSSLIFVFKEEGLYGDLCDSDTITNVSLLNDTNAILGNQECWPQDDRFALCFTLASFSCSGFSSATGYINFKTGLRVTRILCFVMNTTGLLCLAFVSNDNPWLIYPGLCLCSVSGLTLYVTNAQVAYIFPKHGSTYVGLLNGAMDSSIVVFSFVKIAHAHGFSRQKTFLILVAMYCCTLVSTFLFLPKTFVQGEKAYQDIDESNSTSEKGTKKATMLVDSEVQNLKIYLKQPLFISFTLWLSLLQLRFFYFMGTINVYLSNLLDNNQDKVSYYTDICNYTMMTGLITAVLVGMFHDSLKRVFLKRSRSTTYQKIVPAIIPMTCACVLSVVLSILILIRSEPLLYAVFIAVTIKRSFLYPMMSAYVRAVFPSQYFGILVGVALTTSAAFACFQYAFFHWAESYHNGRFNVDICLLFVSLVTLCHPILMWITAARADRDNASICKDCKDQAPAAGDDTETQELTDDFKDI